MKKAIFSKYENGIIYCFINGADSETVGEGTLLTGWTFGKLVKQEDTNAYSIFVPTSETRKILFGGNRASDGVQLENIEVLRFL